MSEALVLYTEPYICSMLHLSLKTSQHLRPQQGDAVAMSLWSDHDLGVSTLMGFTGKSQPQILEEYLKSWVILCAVIFYVSAVVILGISED